MTFQGAITLLIGILNTLVPIIMGLLLIFFIWGLITFIGAGGDTGKISDGKQRMLWGILGIFISVSVWGMVNLLFNTFFNPGDNQTVDVDSLIN